MEHALGSSPQGHTPHEALQLLQQPELQSTVHSLLGQAKTCSSCASHTPGCSVAGAATAPLGSHDEQLVVAALQLLTLALSAEATGHLPVGTWSNQQVRCSGRQLGALQGQDAEGQGHLMQVHWENPARHPTQMHGAQSSAAEQQQQRQRQQEGEHVQCSAPCNVYSLQQLTGLLLNTTSVPCSTQRPHVLAAICAWMLLHLAAASDPGVGEAVASLGAHPGGYPLQVLLMLLQNAAALGATDECGSVSPVADDLPAAVPSQGSALTASRNMVLDAPLSVARGLALLAMSLLPRYVMHSTRCNNSETPAASTGACLVPGEVPKAAVWATAASLQWQPWSRELLRQALDRICVSEGATRAVDLTAALLRPAGLCSEGASSAPAASSRLGQLLPELLLLCFMLQPLPGLGRQEGSGPTAAGASRGVGGRSRAGAGRGAPACTVMIRGPQDSQQSPSAPAWVLADVAEALKERDLLPVLVQGAAAAGPCTGLGTNDQHAALPCGASLTHMHLGASVATTVARLCCSTVSALLIRGLLDQQLARTADLLSGVIAVAAEAGRAVGMAGCSAAASGAIGRDEACTPLQVHTTPWASALPAADAASGVEGASAWPAHTAATGASSVVYLSLASLLASQASPSPALQLPHGSSSLRSLLVEVQHRMGKLGQQQQQVLR